MMHSTINEVGQGDAYAVVTEVLSEAKRQGYRINETVESDVWAIVLGGVYRQISPQRMGEELRNYFDSVNPNIVFVEYDWFDKAAFEKVLSNASR